VAQKYEMLQFSDGIPVKKLLLAIELAEEKSTSKQIKAKYFVEALNAVM